LARWRVSNGFSGMFEAQRRRILAGSIARTPGNLILPLAASTLAFWASVALLGRTGVLAGAWLLLYMLCTALSLLAIWRQRPSLSPAVWLYLALCATLLAAGLFGVNGGLDALHGAHRPKVDVAGAVGGLELWFVLCPGLASSALACAVGAAVVMPTVRRRAGTPCST
jgi:hypothetical protein